MTCPSLSLHALPAIPKVEAGADLAALALAGLARANLVPRSGDAIAIAQKIVSKAEGRQVRLDEVIPGAEALRLAPLCAKDPRLVELILSESQEVMRVRPGVIIVRHRLGLVLANAGIDQSNIGHGDGPSALLLPLDPDATCRQLAWILEQATGVPVPVLIVDSIGRAWRQGTIGTAIGVSGIPALLDLRGRRDLYGRPLESSELGLADEIAAAASLVMGQAAEATPIVLLRGLPAVGGAGKARDLVRPRDLDLFP